MLRLIPTRKDVWLEQTTDTDLHALLEGCPEQSDLPLAILVDDRLNQSVGVLYSGQSPWPNHLFAATIVKEELPVATFNDYKNRYVREPLLWVNLPPSVVIQDKVPDRIHMLNPDYVPDGSIVNDYIDVDEIDEEDFEAAVESFISGRLDNDEQLPLFIDLVNHQHRDLSAFIALLVAKSPYTHQYNTYAF